MTRDKQIKEAVKSLYESPYFNAGFIEGAKWADTHPNWTEIVKRMQEKITNDLRNDRWISVDEALPKEHEWILGFSLKRSYIDVYNFDSNGLFEAHDITHWMHLSPPPVLSKSGNTGKNHLIDANNMVDHFADISKMVEKGGEE